MSSGHHLETPYPSDDLVAQITDEVRAAIAELIVKAKLNDDGWTLPYLAGCSEDMSEWFSDHELPETLKAGGKTFKPRNCLPHHEIPETYCINVLKMIYKDAHGIATFLFEKPYVTEQLDLSWQSYQDAYEPYIHEDEHERVTRVPDNLELAPYLGDKKLLAAMKAAQTSSATKGAVMKEDQIHFFVPITKVEKGADGSRTVTGYASTETLDLDGEIVSKGAIEKALPDYMEWGNIRQMHQPIAVGTAKEANVDDKGLFLTSRIVEPGCIKLLDEKVLKGYSIGGKKMAKSGTTITELQLIEISLVDRPANPDCRIEVAKAAGHVPIPSFLTAPRKPVTIEPEDLGMFAKFMNLLSGSGIDFGKRDFSSKERDAAASSGAAMPDGSFPIENKKDLENAIIAHGRAKNKASAKRHIKARARALGATDALPDDWKSKIAKGGIADFYVVSNLLSLLASLECAEERLEGQADNYCCPFAWGATTVEVSKELTDKFGTMLTQFGDIIAELLDALLSSMGEEEAQELITAATVSREPADIFDALALMAKRCEPIVTPTGDHFAQLKELFNVQ